MTLGGRLVPAPADASARDLGSRAVGAISGGLVGVDLLGTEAGWVVLELNAAIDFDRTYSWPAQDVFVDAATALRLLPSVHRRRAAFC